MNMPNKITRDKGLVSEDAVCSQDVFGEPYHTQWFGPA